MIYDLGFKNKKREQLSEKTHEDISVHTIPIS